MEVVLSLKKVLDCHAKGSRFPVNLMRTPCICDGGRLHELEAYDKEEVLSLLTHETKLEGTHSTYIEAARAAKVIIASNQHPEGVLFIKSANTAGSGLCKADKSAEIYKLSFDQLKRLL